MTPKQQETIEAIRRTIVRLCSLSSPDNYEFKENVLSDLGYDHLSLVVEYGRKNDEGTYAALLCRQRWHLFIGPRGGVELVAWSSGLTSSHPARGSVCGVFKCVNYYPPKALREAKKRNDPQAANPAGS